MRAAALPAIGKTTVTVGDAALTDTSSTVAASGTEGASTGSIVLATFTDANPGNNTADMTATINWGGAGSGSTSGTVTYSGGTYTVTGSFTYGEEGSYTPTVNIADDVSSHGIHWRLLQCILGPKLTTQYGYFWSDDLTPKSLQEGFGEKTLVNGRNACLVLSSSPT